MIAPPKSKRILAALGLISALSIALIVLNIVRDPMDVRMAELESEIEEIQVVPLFIVNTSQTNYSEIQHVVQARNVLWRELIAPPQQAKPTDPGPNFQQILSGVVATTTTMTKNGQPLARIIAPDSPRGRWVTIGDPIASTKVIQITPAHIAVSITQGQKEYKYNIPRQ